MAKILISALGAGKSNRQYPTTKYKIEDSIYEESFIGNALTKHFKIDKNIVIGTKKSLWEELYIVASKRLNIQENEEFYLELSDNIEKGKVNTSHIEKLENFLEKKYKGIIIEYGLNNIELMTNFELLMQITEILESGDELYIDITNSFRSLSLYMFIVINYLKGVANKNIKIAYISYGMFEAKDENDGITPVVNLNLLYEAIEWIKAASDFKKFANSFELTQLLPEEHKKSGEKLNDFTYAFNLSYVNGLKKKIDILYEANNEFEKIQGFGKFIIPPVVNDIVNRFKKYKDTKKEFIFLLTASKLFYDKNLYSGAYIFLQEAIVVYFLEFYDIKEKKISVNEAKYYRGEIKQALSNRNFNSDPDFIKLSNLFTSLTEIRNALAHAIDIYQSPSMGKINYAKDFEKKYFIPLKELLNKNKNYEIIKK